MSFSSDVKTELMSLENVSECCKFAEIYGLLLFSRFFSLSSITFQTENADLADFYANSIRSIFKVNPAIDKSKKGKQIISIDDMSDRIKILTRFGYTGKEISLRINRGNFESDCCLEAFLRGAFLSCGALSSPEKGYHLEFSTPFYKLSQDLLKILDEFELNPKMVTRKGYNIIYIKESENIEELLTHMSAIKSSFELMGVKIYKDFRNKANRIRNCETANITRTINASGTQIDAIKIIQREVGLDSLPDELKEIALLRLEFPEYTLKELHEELSSPLSVSGLNHRLKKIINISKEISSKKEN